MKRGLPAYVYPKGRKGYLYFIRGRVSQRVLSAPGTPEFAAEYARLLKAVAPPPRRTLAKLIVDYRQSPKWSKLAGNTRKSYARHLDYFAEVAGQIDPATMRRVHVNQMRDALADRPTDANRKIGALSVLFEHGIDIGWLDKNPVKGVRRLAPAGRQRQPWPVEMIAAFRAAADERTLLLFELLIGTGQRVNDVLSLRWSDLAGGGFSLTQGKTGTKLFIPLTARLASILDNTPKRALFIVAQDNGNRVGYNLAWKNFMDVRRQIGAVDYDIHGLRHTAASEIAAIPGMTSEHVKAITGHSETAMVMLYAGPAMQKARAAEAQEARGNGSKTKGESGNKS